MFTDRNCSRLRCFAAVRRRGRSASGRALFLAGCGEDSEQTERSSTHHDEARGLVRSHPPDHKTVDIEREDIPGFLPSMTMPFEVRDEKKPLS